MAGPPIPLVWAKLNPPVLPEITVRRDRLTDELARDHTALTAIVAPAGYGKTTVAIQLAHRLDADLAWLSLDPGDADPARFWTYVAAALAAAGLDEAADAYEHVATGDTGLDTATLVLRSAIEAHPRNVTLVLDDVHALDDDRIEAALGEWLRHPLANLRIVCTSRRDLALPVGRLRGQGRLTEARVDDLAFEPDESGALMREAFGLTSLREEQVKALDRRTEGWPVGLYLAGLALRDEADVDAQLDHFTGDTRRLTEYLAAEAMDGVSDDVRAFALATSIVSVLDPDLCDRLTGHPGSLRILRGLVTDNVFTVARDEAATVFSYHPLFREHLRSALVAEHPEIVPDLHARASRWFEERGEVHDAIVHATAAGDIERAQGLIVEHSIHYSNAGHFSTIVGWVDGLGQVDGISTQTSLLMSWVLLNLRRYDDLDRWLATAREAAVTDLEHMMVEIQEHAMLAHKARHEGDVGTLLHHAAIARAEASLEQIGEATSAFLRAEAAYGAARSVAACAAFWNGDLDRAHDDMMSTVSIAIAGGYTLEIVFCRLYLAMIAADNRDSAGALAHADQVLATVGADGERHHQPTLAHLARSIALSDTGRPADAAQALDEARRVGSYRPEPLTDTRVELQQARLHHRAGAQDEARASLRRAREIAAALPDSRLDDHIRAIENEIRFVARDLDELPIGARELTDRELVVLRLLPHQLSRRQLAEQLHVSENTVKTHLTSIRHKLGVSGRGSIVERAEALGLLGQD